VEAYHDYVRMIFLAAAGRRLGNDLKDEQWKKKCDEFWRDYDAKQPGEVPKFSGQGDLDSCSPRPTARGRPGIVSS